MRLQASHSSLLCTVSFAVSVLAQPLQAQEQTQQDALQRILDNVPRVTTPQAAPSPSPSTIQPPEQTGPTEEEILQDFVAKDHEFSSVFLQGLDKLTAQREQFHATMGAVTRFGNLEIVPRACWKSPPSERPETAALLEIWEWRPTEQPIQRFFGWMFASSPALSSLEHPVYDVTVLDCVEKSEDSEENAE